MKFKSLIKAIVLLLVGAVLGVVAFLVFAVTQADPEKYGLTEADFEAPQHTDLDPADVVKPLAHNAVSTSDLTTTPTTESRSPNIVVILADDLGYGDLDVYGSRAIETPQMDRLAREGLRFTHAYSSAPICSPSRAGLLTGRYPLRSGVMTAMQMAGDSPIRKATYQAGIVFAQLAAVDMPGGRNAVLGLPPSEITIPEALDLAGYTSMAVGKWHLGDFTVRSEFHPFNHGFDEFVGFNGSNDDFPIAFWRGEEEVLENVGADQEKYTGLFTDEAVAFIERQAGNPFFLYLSHKDPHLPFFPSEAFAGKSEGGPYGDAVSELDASVGRVIETLEANGLAENTLVLLTSDNGPWFDGSTADLRGRKGQSYEGGFRVPLIAWWPGRIEPGGESSAPVMNIDFLPTFLTLAGLAPPDDRAIDGRDLSPLLFARADDEMNSTAEAVPGNAAATDETTLGNRTSNSAMDPFADRTLFFFHDYDVEAVRRGDWKYYDTVSHYTWPVPLDDPGTFGGKLAGARDYIPEGGGEPIPTLGTWPNLYHLGRDPGEAYNVVEKHPDVAERLGRELNAWRETFYANPRGWK